MEQTERTEQRVRITSHSMAEQYGRKTSYLDARIRALKRRLSYDEWHALEPWEEPRPVRNSRAQYPSWSFSEEGAKKVIKHLGLEKQK